MMPLLQRRHGGTQLEGGAGGVDALGGAVEHRQPLVGRQLLVVLVERRPDRRWDSWPVPAPRRCPRCTTAAAPPRSLLSLSTMPVNGPLASAVLRRRPGGRCRVVSATVPPGWGSRGVQLAGELAVFVGGDEPSCRPRRGDTPRRPSPRRPCPPGRSWSSPCPRSPRSPVFSLLLHSS